MDLMTVFLMPCAAREALTSSALPRPRTRLDMSTYPAPLPKGATKELYMLGSDFFTHYEGFYV